MPTIPDPAASRQTHPGVVTRVQLLCHGGDVLHQELVPLPLEGDLVHVDVNSGHVFITTLDTGVLEVTRERIEDGTQTPKPDTQSFPLTLVQDRTLYDKGGALQTSLKS